MPLFLTQLHPQLEPFLYHRLHLQGDSIWYEPGTKGEFDLPIGGKVLAADAGQIQLSLATGEVRAHQPAPVIKFPLS